MVFSLLSGLPAIGMVCNRLERLPAEVTVEIARYYVYAIVPKMEIIPFPVGGYETINKGYALIDAVKAIKNFYEMHPECKRNIPVITKGFLEHLSTAFRKDRELSDLQYAIDALAKPNDMTVFKSPIIIASIVEQKRIFAQERELFRSDMYEKAWFGYPCSAMKKIIDLGIDVNARDEQERTPLMLACKAGNGPVVKCLLQAGANVTLRDRDGRTALTYVPPYNEERYNAINRLLVQAGANANQIPAREEAPPGPFLPF